MNKEPCKVCKEERYWYTERRVCNSCMERKRYIEDGSIWTHKNGIDYQVMFIANGHNKATDTKPPMVIYKTIANGNIWARPLTDWDRSFTYKSEGKLKC